MICDLHMKNYTDEFLIQAPIVTMYLSRTSIGTGLNHIFDQVVTIVTDRVVTIVTDRVVYLKGGVQIAVHIPRNGDVLKLILGNAKLVEIACVTCEHARVYACVCVCRHRRCSEREWMSD